jgi:hypothetical protein
VTRPTPKPVFLSWPQLRQRGQQLVATLRPPITTPEGEPIPDALVPHAEGRAASIPYRGMQVHGGPHPEAQAYVTDNDYLDTDVNVVWNEPEEKHIVDVRVIQDSGEQITNFRAGQFPTGDNAQMIFNRNRSRTSLKIKNLSATGGNSCWIGADESVNAMNGYRLDPGETLELQSTEDVWAINAAPGAPVMLSFLMHYTQEV